MNLGLAATLPIFLYHLACYQQRQGLNCVILHAILHYDHWGEPNVDGRIILRGIFRKWEGVVGTEWNGSG
jgi:hypothetical protein